jgi:hypothetical protein
MNARTAVLAALAAAALFPSAQALAVGSLTDVQVYDRAENRYLPVYWHEGKAWLVGKPGNEYQISVRNRAGGDVLTVVSVDGVNVVSGETAAPDQTGYVLSNGVSYDVKGWRKSLSRTAAFYFTQLPDSYAARTGRPDNVGVIGVAVFRRKPAPPPVSISPPVERRERSSAEWQRDDAQPKPEAPRASASGAAGAPAETTSAMRQQAEKLGTGHGRSETSIVRNVSFERATPYPEEVITLYYDSASNLMARGVIPQIPVVRPQPQPFPGRFVADPPRS